MQKIRIIGLQSQKERIIAELHRIGVIDIRKSALDMEDDRPAESLPDISELVVRYNSALSILEKYRKKQKHAEHHARERQPRLPALLKTAGRPGAVSDTLSLEERLTVLEGDISRMDQESATMSLFLGSGIDFSLLRSESLDFAAYLMSGGTHRKAHRHIAELRKDYEVIESTSKRGVAVLVAFKKDEASVLEKFEQVKGIRAIDISSERFDSTPEKVIKEIAAARAKAEEERKEAVAKLEKHAALDYSRIASVLEMLSVDAERASASINFKRTESTFVVEGWVERRKLGEVSTQVGRVTDGHFAIEEFDDDELAPTSIVHSRFLRPFDALVEFFSLPRSDELDPTMIFVLSFPIFYGLMVSDVGYGIVSFIFAELIARISDKDGLLYNVAKVWQISAIAIIFFGFISNQYFGFQLNQYFTSFTGFDWLRNSPTVLAATVIFGLIQVVAGLAFSFVNNYDRGHKKMAVSKLSSIVVIIAGTVAVSGALFGVFGLLVTQATTAIAIAALMVTVALSGSEATEVVSLISHPLSYARIMGFGLASVILAMLIDKAFTPSLSGGIPAFVLTLIIFILLHFVNMLLGTFEGLVQGVRLNFVEFFSKFYTGGGVKFRPFFYKRRYTKEV